MFNDQPTETLPPYSDRDTRDDRFNALNAGLRMNRDCSVLGIGSGVQTDTDQVFYFSAETETEPR